MPSSSFSLMSACFKECCCCFPGTKLSYVPFRILKRDLTFSSDSCNKAVHVPFLLQSFISKPKEADPSLAFIVSLPSPHPIHLPMALLCCSTWVGGEFVMETEFWPAVKKMVNVFPTWYLPWASWPKLDDRKETERLLIFFLSGIFPTDKKNY